MCSSALLYFVQVENTMRCVLVFCLVFAAAAAHAGKAQGRVNATRTGLMLRNVVDNFDSLDQRGRITVINDFVDTAMLEASKLIIDLGFDPMPLPDLYEKISFKPILITYWGDLNLERGWLQDASTIHRQGDVEIDYTNRVLRMKVPIAFRDFVFDYQYRVRIMGLGPKGGVDGKTTDIRCTFILELDFKELHLTLKDFEITRIGKISISFNGNVLTDWLLNLMTSTITTLFRGVIQWVCELIVRDVLYQIVDAVNSILDLLPIAKADQIEKIISLVIQ